MRGKKTVLWLRYKTVADSTPRYGIVEQDVVQACTNAYNLIPTAPEPTGERLPIDAVEILMPCQPTKIIALWNNFRALADAKKLTYPDTPLYLFKPPNSWLASDRIIKHPPAYDGKVFFEGELGIVIGREASNLKAGTGADAIAGYTCINDVTAFDLLKDYDGFDQWSRAKGFDTFGVVGPTLATGLDWKDLIVTTRVNGDVVQQYPAEDMLMSPEEIVCALSRNMTLYPGDVICCGTSIGLGPMPEGCLVEVEINGIGCLRNTYRR